MESGKNLYSNHKKPTANNKLQKFRTKFKIENKKQFFIPRGFAHGFSVLSEEVIFQYKCDNFYSPQSEGAIAWNDPDLNIDWRIPAEKVVLSEKDSKHPRLKDWQNVF